MTPGNELIVQQYFRAWSSHDGGALSALFDENGTYEGPATPMAVHAFDLSAIVEALVAQFSDFSFEIVRLGAAHDLVYAEWMLRGTSDGPVKKGVDATGESCTSQALMFKLQKGR